MTLRGRHIRLEPLAPEHANALVEAWNSSSEVSEHVRFDLTTPERARAWIAATPLYPEEGEEVPFAVVLAASARVVGSTRFMAIQPRWRSCEIGVTFYARDVWGTAVNPEAKYLLLRHAFESWGAIRVQLKTDVRNARSQRAILGIGASYEGILRNHRIRKDGSYRDSVLFSIIESDWPEVKRRLEERLAGAVVA